MNKHCAIPLLALLLFSAVSALHATAYTRASQAVTAGGPYDMNNIIYYGHGVNTITFRDAANGSILVVIPENRMASVRDVVLAYRYQPFNFRIRITAPYNPQTRGCSGTFVSFIQTPSQPGSGTVNLARSVNRTGGSTIRNLAYLTHTATSISFRDAEDKTVVAVVPAHQLLELLNPIIANRNNRYDVTLEITHVYTAQSRECRGTYRNHMTTRETGSQQSSSSSARSGTRTVADGSRVTDSGRYEIRNLTYTRHNQTYFYFRDIANNEIHMIVSRNQHQTLVSQIAANPSRMYTLTVDTESAYNAHLRTVRCRYVSHTSTEVSTSSNPRNIRYLQDANTPGVYRVQPLRNARYNPNNLTYTFSDDATATIIIQLASADQHTVISRYLNFNSGLIGIQFQTTHIFDAQTRQCRGTYISHF